MDFRSLIHRAILEAGREYEEVIRIRLAARLLEAIREDEESKGAKTTKAKKPKKDSEKPAAKPRTATRLRATSADAGSMRDRILTALQKKGDLARANLLSALKLTDADEARLGTALVRLRTDGVITMTGTRRGATYRLTSA